MRQELAMHVLIVLYKSALGLDRVKALFRERAAKYREVPGLTQKLYVHDPETGQVGGIYVFDTREALEAFRGSGLEKSIQQVYQFTEPPTLRVLEVVQALREPPARAS
jgi:hypothetical protein